MKSLELQTWIDEFNPGEINIDKLKEYLDFLELASKRFDKDRYSERHHIFPRCVDKEHKYSGETLRINGADHFRAHLLLVDCFNGNKSYRLSYALTKILKDKIKEEITPEEYELARELNSKALSNRKLSKESREKLSQSKLGNKSNTGKIWITNGVVNYMIPHNENIPEGFWRGHLKDSDETRRKKGEASKGRSSNRGQIWINNGNECKMIPKTQEIPLGWFKGMIVDASSRAQGNTNVRGRIWIKNGTATKRVSPEDFETVYRPQGWVKGRGE